MNKLNYCQCGNELIFNSNSTLYPENYYCNKCDKIYVKRLVEEPKDIIEKYFGKDRFSDLRSLALTNKARSKVTRDDLKKLKLL